MSLPEVLPSPDEAPAVDAEAIAALRRWQRPGAPALLARLVAMYRAEAPERLEAIDAAIAGGHAEDLRQAAHPLKSSSAMLGAKRLAALGASLEDCGRECRLADAAGLAAQAREELGRVLGELDRLAG